MTPTTKRALERASVFFRRDITLNDLRKRCRSPQYSRPRFFVMAYLRAQKEKPLSYPQIANILRLKDHTSVLHGEDRARTLWPEIDFDQMVQEDFTPVREIDRLLNEGRDNFLTWRFLNGGGWKLEEAA